MRGTLYIVAAPSGAGKTSLVNALLEREPGSVFRCRTRRACRDPAKSTASTIISFRARCSSAWSGRRVLSTRMCTAISRAPRAAPSSRCCRRRRRVARDRLARRAAGAKGAAGLCQRVHPAAVARRARTPPAHARVRQAATIARRLADSREEIAHAGDFDYIMVNDDSRWLADLRAIVTTRRLRREAQMMRHAALLGDLLKPA